MDWRMNIPSHLTRRAPPTPDERTKFYEQIGQAAERLGAQLAPLRTEGWHVTLTIDEHMGTVTLAIDVREGTP